MANGEPDVARPSWMPPDDVLAAIVPMGQFLIRAERMIVALSHLSVYPNGCMFDVQASARGSDAVPGVFDRIVFTTRFGAGIAAATDAREPLRRRPPGGDALTLMKYGQQEEGSHGAHGAQDSAAACTLRLWLYPLPPPEPGTLSIASPDHGPGQTSCPLDGRTIVTAGAEAQPYWR